jgi:hypothetical protein
MKKGLRWFGVISGSLASLLCIAGGAWILAHVDYKSGDDDLWIGIGLYFLGKGVFVGPMLALTALKEN